MIELDQKPKSKRWKIGKGAWIMDSSGTAPDGAAMKRQADNSSLMVNKLFEDGTLRLEGTFVSNGVGLVPVDQDNQSTPDN